MPNASSARSAAVLVKIRIYDYFFKANLDFNIR